MVTICLNMIVKNEAHVIRRGLDTVKPFINHWIIVDTGSTDGTQDIIREHMKDIPGELIERPWKNFAHNRTEAIEYARNKADYLMFLDADEEFVTPAGWKMPPLTADGYQVTVDHPPDFTYDRISLVAMRLPWRYIGVLHEHVDCGQTHTLEILKDVSLRENQEGARSLNPHKFEHDAAVLEVGLREEPNNSRYVFYLAQSYRGAGQCRKAYDAYKQRTSMGGWGEEVWYAYYQMALMAESLEFDEGQVILHYIRAYQHRPVRAESLYNLARFCRTRKLWALAYLFGKTAAEIQHPPHLQERLFLEESVYAWRALDEWSVAASWVGRHPEAKVLYERLLANPGLPDSERARIKENIDISVSAMKKNGTDIPAPSNEGQS